MNSERKPYPPDRTVRSEKIRIAVRHLIATGHLPSRNGRSGTGVQSRLADHFGVTRQRVSQILAAK